MVNSVSSNLVNFRSVNPLPVRQKTNFRASDNYNNYEPAEQDMFMYQMQQERKSQKSRDRWNKAGVIASCAIAGSLALGALVQVPTLRIKAKLLTNELKKQTGESKKAGLNFFDVTNEKSFEQLTLSKEMKKVVEDMKTSIDRAEWLKKKGANGGNGIMLYGEPGGGKNAYVYAYTKYLQEKFPGSKLIMMDVLKFKDKYVGETENNIINFVENTIKEAKANPDKRYVVFLDEFDSIARKDESQTNKALAESFQNAFKTTLTKLTDVENIQVIAATNKASKDEAITKLLDDAIMNRFPKKYHVPLPNEEQLRIAITEHYKTIPSDLVDSKLTDKNNSELKRLCKYITNKNHHASFRDMQYILDEARIISESKNRTPGSKITIKDLKQAVKNHAENENWERGKGKSNRRKNRELDDNTEKLSFWQRLKALFGYGD